MARRKNYSFERSERDRQKAAKRLAKRAAKESARAAKSDDPEATEVPEGEEADEVNP